jgi:uncharacterized membrane protein YphA (DoxX/SURF4 family)
MLLSGLAVWPGAFLVAGGAAKTLELRRKKAGRNTVLARALASRGGMKRQVGEPIVPLRLAWGVVGGLELLVGLAVLSGLATPVPEIAAVLMLAAAAALAAWGLRAAPHSGCGCFGTNSKPVSTRTPIRAGALAALALLAAVGGSSWYDAFREPWAIVAMVVAGIAVGLLAPELDVRKSVRTLRYQARETACKHRRIPPERTIERLRASRLWTDAQAYLAAESPLEHWREGCFRYLVYPARYEGEAASAVFALYLGGDRSADGVAFVHESDQRVLGQIRGSK